MEKDHKQLPVPSAAKTASRSIEIARVWVADGAQHVSLATSLWPDPAAWGLMLVDLAQHVANAYEEVGDLERSQALARIREAFDAEWNEPTDKPSGGLRG